MRRRVTARRPRSDPTFLSPLEAAENGTLPTVVVKDVQMSGSAHGDRPLRGDQEYPVHEVVGDSGSDYKVTVLTKLWLLKASVDPKLIRKYRAEQRAATKVRTRWSSRLQNQNRARRINR